MNNLVYKTSDQFGDIFVVDQGSFRNLMFDRQFEQSSIHLEIPNKLVHEYMQAMMLVAAFIKPAHLTLLGFGAGCLARAFGQTLPDCKIHAVELREKLYAIAKEFFAFPANNQLQFTVADAHQWLKSAEENSTSIILSDLFHAHGMEPKQQHKNFIYHCHRLLTKKGWLVMNYHKIPELDDVFFTTLGQLFAEVFICPIDSGNNIIFASKTSVKRLKQFDPNVALLEKKLGMALEKYFNRFTRL